MSRALSRSCGITTGAAAIAALAVLAGCTQTLPAPAPPAARAWTADAPGEPPPGEGWIALESDGDPTTAVTVEGYARAVAYGPGGTAVATGIATRHLCRTPCLAALPLGDQEVILTGDDGVRGARGYVRVAADPSHVQVALGSLDQNHAARYGAILSLTAAVGFGTAGLIADDDASTYYGLAAGTFVAGLALAYLGRIKYRPGTFAQYRLTP